jgi:hypothetical protein
MKPIDLVAVVLLGGVVVGGVVFVVTRQSPAPASGAYPPTGPMAQWGPQSQPSPSTPTPQATAAAEQLRQSLASNPFFGGNKSSSSGSSSRSSGGGIDGAINTATKIINAGSAAINAIGKLGIF